MNGTESWEAARQFGAMDYTVFALMLAVSLAIGFYFGCIIGKQNSVAEYLLGSKQMQTFPIAMSLISSQISGITLLGVPTEVYTYGTQYVLTLLANAFAGMATLWVFLPVFYKLELLSLYEYLELRFNKKVRLLASFLFTLALLTWVPIVIYGPALALNQVSGMNIHLVTFLTCAVCIFYTTVGGLKAVVWTDAVQCVCMIFAVTAVVVLGVVKAGGFSAIFHSALEGDRVHFFNMNPHPIERLSFWTATFSFGVAWTGYVATNPSCVQRFTALPTYRQAQASVVYLVLGIFLFTIPSMFIGLIMYSMYKDCDPLTAEIISRPDQILPYFVLDVAGHIKGLPGLFIVGICSAALSSMSTALNSMAGTLYEDFILPFMPKDVTDAKSSFIMKIIAAVLGVICVIFVGVIERMGAILQLSYSFSGVTVGSVLGIFLLGVMFPTSNAKGAITGGLSALVFLTWVMVGNRLASTNGLLKYPTKPVRVDGCGFNVTSVYNATLEAELSSQVPYLYKISVFNYGLIGTLITVVTGLVVSHATRPLKMGEVHPDLLSPMVHRFLPKSYSAVPLREKRGAGEGAEKGR